MGSSWIVSLAPTARKPQRYQAVYRDEDDRQRSAGVFPRKADAKKALADISVRLERGTWIDPKAGRVSIAQYADLWLASKQVSPSTRAKLAGQLRREIVPEFGHYEVRGVTTMMIRTWVSKMSTRLAPQTVQGVAHTFSSLLKQAVEDGLVSSNPCRLGRGALPRIEPTAKMFLTIDQLDALTRNTDPHYRPLVHLAAWTGMRWGEVNGLEWETVDLDAATLDVVRAASRGDKDELYYGPPKTDSSRRTISLDEDTVQVLRGHWRKNRRAGLVFRTKMRKPIPYAYFRRDVWNPACVATFAEGASGLDRSCPTCLSLPGVRCVEPSGLTSRQPHKPRFAAQLPTFHDLRATHLSHLLVAGVDPVTVSKRAGHSTVTMTLNIYGRLRSDHADVVNAAISGLRGKAPGTFADGPPTPVSGNLENAGL